MNFIGILTFLDLQAVVDHDRKHWRSNNRTRFYKYLRAVGDDIEVHTVAIKAKNRYSLELVAKEVVRASVNDAFVYVKDIAFLNMAGYSVDWSPDGIGPAKGWHYDGAWGSAAYEQHSGLWKLQCEVVNPEELQKSERFKWCSWTPECGDILDYLKMYKAHPRLELLSKSGLGYLSLRSSFVKSMEQSKAFSKYVIDNISRIARNRFGAQQIQHAYRRKIDLVQAGTELACKQVFHGFRLPAAVDPVRAVKYIGQQYIRPEDYAKYVNQCIELGLSLADTKNTFPAKFITRSRIVADRYADLQQQKDSLLRHKRDIELKAVAQKWVKALGSKRGAFVLVIPSRTIDLIREGERLHNCLGQGHYAAKIARGESVIVFIRKRSAPSKAFVAAEYSPKQKRVMQCYAAKNQKPEKHVINFINRVFERKIA